MYKKYSYSLLVALFLCPFGLQGEGNGDLKMFAYVKQVEHTPVVILSESDSENAEAMLQDFNLGTIFRVFLVNTGNDVVNFAFNDVSYADFDLGVYTDRMPSVNIILDYGIDPIVSKYSHVGSEINRITLNPGDVCMIASRRFKQTEQFKRDIINSQVVYYPNSDYAKALQVFDGKLKCPIFKVDEIPDHWIQFFENRKVRMGMGVSVDPFKVLKESATEQ